MVKSHLQRSARFGDVVHLSQMLGSFQLRHCAWSLNKLSRYGSTYIYIYTHTYVYIYIGYIYIVHSSQRNYRYPNKHYPYVYIYIHTYIYIYIYIYIYMYMQNVYIYRQLYVYIYIYLHIYIYIWISMYIYIYIIYVYILLHYITHVYVCTQLITVISPICWFGCDKHSCFACLSSASSDHWSHNGRRALGERRINMFSLRLLEHVSIQVQIESIWIDLYRL